MIAEIWTKPMCSTCQEEKRLLRSEGYEVREYVIKGREPEEMEDMERDVFVQLHCQDGMFPVIRINGAFKMPGIISQAMEWS